MFCIRLNRRGKGFFRVKSCPTNVNEKITLCILIGPTIANNTIQFQMDVGDGDDDGKSSMAPMMTPRSVTPANTAQAAVPQTAASNAERIQSSIGEHFYC